LLWEIFRFEVRYQLRQPIFAIAFALFFLLTFGAVTTDAVTIGGSIGAVNRNAPFVIVQLLLIMSVIGVFTTTTFVAGAVQRDFEHHTHEIFFSTSMKKRDYLVGRFAGSLVAAVGVMLGVVAGILVGSAMPWLDPARVGPTSAAPYLFAMCVMVLPNLLLTGALFFGLASLTRSMLWTFVGVIGFLMAYFVGQAFLQDLESQRTAVLLDPFGIAAFEFATKYWTVADKNAALMPLAGAPALNRALWLGVAVLVFASTYRLFRFSASPRGRKGRAGPADAVPAATAGTDSPPAAAPAFSRVVSLRQYLHRTGLELLSIMKGVPFLVLLLFGVLNILGNSVGVDELFGTPIHPVTQVMLRVIAGSFSLTLVLILTWYSGELAWRERNQAFDGVLDAMPVPTGVFWLSKLTALVGSLVVLLAVAMSTGIALQAYHGHYRFEPLLYLKGLFLAMGVPLALVAVASLFVQAATNSRYLGMLLMVLYYISGPVLTALGWEHRLYHYAAAPEAPYSDMNGYGHFVAPLFWYYAYWALFALLLAVATHLLWVRGAETSLRTRLALARRRLTAVPRAALALGTAGAFGLGAFIFHNTNVLNRYVPRKAAQRRQAELEKKYKRYEGAPGPRITAVRADVDIHPETRSVAIRGEYTLQNKTASPIEAVHVALNPEVAVHKLDLPGSRLEMEDRDLGYAVYRLARPLAPGEQTTLSYDLAVESRGFRNNGAVTNVVANGTFFNSFDYFPHLGYSRDRELRDPNERRRHGLPPVVRMPKLEDEGARRNNQLSLEADWLTFDTTVSTSPDQVAIAPGYLQKEWTAGGRRYFHYKMDAPILGFWAYLSARYQVKRDRWNDVAIEVYYHPGHDYNVDRMIHGVKKSLDYFTMHFGPYQHRQVRILEFPRYARFAQSFPNTIPFSESIGFIAKLEDEDDIDYVFYVTAHEVAHQWWGHQVMGADVQGATVISETLSQYSALMVMEKEYGPEKMRRFLKYELEAYLRGRGGELIEELPLLRVEDQAYVHYRKGSLALYALRDHVGEGPLNRALAAFVRDKKFQGPPYTTTQELLGYLRQAVPADRPHLLEDLFETITLHENQAREATWEKRPDGRYLVKLLVEARKSRAAGSGEERPVAVDDWIDVGVFGKKQPGTPPDGKVLLLRKHHVTGGGTIELVVDEEPVKAGIDPLNKLIDRTPENNLTGVAPGTAR
jgi:ABC-2 type transport system permease protein